MNNFQKGSEWRRWDLHLHTPNTKLSNDYGHDATVWDRYIENLESSPVEAFGITDYFSADGYYALLEKYLEKYPDTKKVFFLNIEFRVAEAISAKDTNPHIHVIFDNDENNCSRDDISRFLVALKTHGESASGVRLSCDQLKAETDFMSASVSLEDIKNALKETFGEAKPYLLAFPAKNDGVRSTDSKSPRKVLITDKIDRWCHLFFGPSDSRDYFLKTDRYQEGKSEPKPVISGSDAHSFSDLERLEGNVAGFEPTWIKADLTFRGLKQICFEPDARVFIGTDPEVETRKAHEATKFLSELHINQINGYDERNGCWFKDVAIPLNPELTVIIGNKGSGKSALVDIIGLLGESRQSEYFSFLSDKGSNKKFKQRGYAENFEAKIIWQSGVSTPKNLNANVDITKPEAVRYLPQNYFEQLTNDIEIQEFRRKIEDVVFSHVEETDRMGKTTFSDLQEFKTQQTKQETSALETKLRELNLEIVNLEEQADPLHKKQLEEKLKTKQAELNSLIKAPPTVVEKPEQENLEQQGLSIQIADLTSKQKQLHDTEQKVVDTLTRSKNRLQQLSSLLQSVQTIDGNLAAQKAELLPTCNELGLNIDLIVKAEIDISSIQEHIVRVQAEILHLEKDNQSLISIDFDFSTLKSLPDLRAGYKFLGEQINELKEKLGTPQRKYQGYLDKLAKWNAQKLAVIGDNTEHQGETIKYFESQITYIENTLAAILAEKIAARKTIVEQIFTSKKKVLTFYSDVKKSVEEKLSSVRTDDFSVDIDASFVLDSTFPDEFLNHINKKKRGSFQGANDPAAVLKTLLAEVDWNDFESVYKFFEATIATMRIYKGESLSLKDQVIEIKEFYDFIFSLGYFSTKYELRSVGKNLNELSPGEKGLLLLVFYLQLDKDNIPLVIDQPEDNLDNDSIFAILAKCIREAKKSRQVILVTHNPNLAVGADAEQIIYVKLEKSDKYKFSYESGSIENQNINDKIVLVLEGSQPAFIKRRLKYQI